MPSRAQRSSLGRAVVIGLETLAAVAVSTGLVAVLETVAPATGLGVIYLLAVLFVAIRHGELAALISAVLGVLALNFFFIDPRYQFEVHESSNLVALAVLLVAAIVVGRLATAARERADEAERRARIAAVREREARMLAAAASSLVDGGGLDTQLDSIRNSSPPGAGHVRVELQHAPVPRSDEIAVRLPTSGRQGWLYLGKDLSWTKEDQDRIAEALAGLIDVALERERLNAQAADAEATRRAEVVKTAVLHAISHDLRSPLTSITTAAGGLRDEGISPEDSSELVSVISDEAARLSRLVDDLLDLSRIEAGAVDPRPDWCDIRDVIATAAAQVRSRHGNHPIEFALSPDLPLVRADPVQLERVFTNLIENAVKFSPSEAPVRITGNASGGRVTVRVLDRGEGVPRSERARIFEPFVRGRDPAHGSGLGLAICKGFVEANGGRIALQTGEDETAFAVTLPLSPQPALT